MPLCGLIESSTAFAIMLYRTAGLASIIEGTVEIPRPVPLAGFDELLVDLVQHLRARGGRGQHAIFVRHARRLVVFIRRSLAGLDDLRNPAVLCVGPHVILERILHPLRCPTPFSPIKGVIALVILADALSQIGMQLPDEAIGIVRPDRIPCTSSRGSLPRRAWGEILSLIFAEKPDHLFVREFAGRNSSSDEPMAFPVAFIGTSPRFVIFRELLNFVVECGGRLPGSPVPQPDRCLDDAIGVVPCRVHLLENIASPLVPSLGCVLQLPQARTVQLR